MGTRKISLALFLIILLFFLLPKLVAAGISTSIAVVELSPFERKEVCGVCIFSTMPQKATFQLQYSDNLKKFVEKIYPANFELQPIECPMEPKARRACIDVECLNPSSTSAKTVCTVFKGPFELSLFPKKQEYRGAVRSVEKVGAAVMVIPTDFIVYYTPFNAWLIIIPIIAALAIVIALIKMRRWKK